MSTAENTADDLQQEMLDLGARARAAASVLAKTTAQAKNRALLQAASAMRAGSADILAANALDMAAAERRDLTAALLDRLLLTEDRIEAMARWVI